jgi:hypothetical protein
MNDSNSGKDDKVKGQGVQIDQPAAAHTEHRDEDLPTDTPVMKQGPNTFSGEEAKDWDQRNS